jgi:nucleoid-associated protein YgaU
MAIRRYSTSSRLALGTRYGTSDAIVKIRQSIDLGLVPFKTVVIAKGQRLDTVAGAEYGNGSLWWIIAAASNIGWSPQVPPGTVLRVPISLSSIEKALAV